MSSHKAGQRLSASSPLLAAAFESCSSHLLSHTTSAPSMAPLKEWAYSSVKLGDEQKPGVERLWASEYGSEFSKARLCHETWIDRTHPFYDCPCGPKHGLAYCGSNRSQSLAKRLGQRIKEKSRHSVGVFRKEVAKATRSPANVPLRDAEALLAPWGFELSAQDKASLLKQYPAAGGPGLVDLASFLAEALPRDFGTKAQVE